MRVHYCNKKIECFVSIWNNNKKCSQLITNFIKVHFIILSYFKNTINCKRSKASWTRNENWFSGFACSKFISFILPYCKFSKTYLFCCRYIILQFSIIFSFLIKFFIFIPKIFYPFLKIVKSIIDCIHKALIFFVTLRSVNKFNQCLKIPLIFGTHCNNQSNICWI